MFVTGSISNNPGAFFQSVTQHLLTVGWLYAGAPAQNIKIFTSQGSSGDDLLALQIDDTDASFTKFQLGTGYDNGLNALLNPTDARYLHKALSYDSLFWLMVDADRFIISSKCLRGGLLNYCTIYAGLPSRYDASDIGAVILFGSPDQSTPWGLAHSTSLAGGIVQILKDNSGAYNKTFGATAINASFAPGQLPNIVDGNLILGQILVGNAVNEITGFLSGVYSLGGSSIVCEDTFIKNGLTYICFFTGPYKIAILCQ